MNHKQMTMNRIILKLDFLNFFEDAVIYIHVAYMYFPLT